MPDRPASAKRHTGTLDVAIVNLRRRHCCALRSRVASAANRANVTDLEPRTLTAIV